MILALALIAAFTLPPDKCNQTPIPCVAANVPLLSFGFQQTAALPHGDLFLLQQTLSFQQCDAPDGTTVQTLSNINFGENPAYNGITPQVFTLGPPSSFWFCFGPPQDATLRVISNPDSFRLIHFALAGAVAQGGEFVRLLFFSSLGEITLAQFRIDLQGATLIYLDPNVGLFLNDVTGDGTSKNVGDFLSFTASAGENGSHTGLLTIKVGTELQGCYPLGLEIIRRDATGQASVALIAATVNRNTKPDDAASTQSGLLGGLTGGFPTQGTCFLNQ
ncbi:MAG: hypothetical protein C4321_08425 [Chloroflexota bacterium]